MSEADPELFDLNVSPPDDDRRWIVCYDDDYIDFMHDANDNVALLVDIEQAGEILGLAAEVVASLSHKDAAGDDVLRTLKDELEEEIGDE